MKIFEGLLKLPKCDTETERKHMLQKKMELTGLLDAGLPKTFNFLKKEKKENSVCEVQYSETIKFGMPIL